MMEKQKCRKLFCSRFGRTKKEAEKIAAKMRAVGGVEVTVTGQRGSWRVRGKVDVVRFCKFCADEAEWEQRAERDRQLRELKEWEAKRKASSDELDQD